MAIDFKSKKLWACVGGGVLTVLCIVAMSKCSSNAGDRDEAQQDLAAQTVRADSLQQELNSIARNRDYWRAFAHQRGDTISMLRNDTALTDSIVVLNDSIEHLVAERDSLQRSLNDCRGSRRSTPARRRQSNGGRNNNAGGNNGGNSGNNANNGSAPVQNNGGNVNNNNNNNNIIFVPAQPATNVTVNGGNGNTVNVNNGTVNNFYAPAPASNNTVRINSSASVSTTYVVKVLPAKTR